jgi:hypothetical protein
VDAATQMADFQFKRLHDGSQCSCSNAHNAVSAKPTG